MKNLISILINNNIMKTILLLVLLAVIFFKFYDPLGPVGKKDEELLIRIPVGSSTRQIAEMLSERGLIKNDFIFIIYSRITGHDTKFQAGDYLLRDSLSLPEIVEKLSKGEVQAISFTIPEGYTVEQIAEVLAAKGLVEKKEFLKLAKEGDFAYPFINRHEDVKYALEGYLFPDTYRVSTNSSAEEIIHMMLKRFQQVYDENARLKAKEMGLTDPEVITIASLIEKEAKTDRDRYLISGVIYNRLEQGMKLQIDATIQYILGQPKTRLTYKDLEISSPYNTYLISGLPPGPIASPGQAAIEAALNPERTNYLFYVAKSDGSHVFSETLEEHNAAKRKYLK